MRRRGFEYTKLPAENKAWTAKQFKKPSWKWSQKVYFLSNGRWNTFLEKHNEKEKNH